MVTGIGLSARLPAVWLVPVAGLLWISAKAVSSGWPA